MSLSVWPQVNENTGGYNKTGLVLALICLAESYVRPAPAHNGKEPVKVTQPQQSPSPKAFAAAAPFGALIYILHNYLSDSSTLIAWSWTGYLNGQPKGPLPHVYGSLTLIAQSIGLLLGLAQTSLPFDIIGHLAWLVYGSASAAVTYFYKDWVGYLGGLNFALFTMSVIPHVFRQASAAASATSVAKVYFHAMLVYVLISLANVWTVAYAFVPGGPYLRERTDL
jgi:hypothetical protein